jgi:hypothetical protein
MPIEDQSRSAIHPGYERKPWTTLVLLGLARSWSSRAEAVHREGVMHGGISASVLRVFSNGFSDSLRPSQ